MNGNVSIVRKLLRKLPSKFLVVLRQLRVQNVCFRMVVFCRRAGRVGRAAVFAL